MQLLGIDHNKYSDTIEFIIQSIARMNSFCWARVLTDFLISTLERFVGKVDIKWVGSSASESAAAAANRHLQLLASASGALFGSNNGVHFNAVGSGHFGPPVGGEHFGGNNEATTAGIISM